MKNKTYGWKNVFCFTFIQTIKAKSFIISTLVLCLIALAGLPVYTIFTSSSGKKNTDMGIETVYIVDGTGMDLFEEIKEYDAPEQYRNINYILSDIDINSIHGKTEVYEETENSGEAENSEETEISEDTETPAGVETSEETVKKNESELKDIFKFDKDKKEIYLVLGLENDTAFVQVVYSGDTKVSEDEIDNFSDYIENSLLEVILKAKGYDEKNIKLVMSDENVEMAEIETGDEEEVVEESNDKHKTNESNGNLIYALCMVCIFILAFGGERIAMSIIVEKSSKIMEFLMTSIKPMAVVIGKVLSGLLSLLIQIILIIGSFGGSVYISGVIAGDGEFVCPKFLEKTIGGMDIEPVGVIIGIVFFLLGLLFYGLIASVAGAAVSRMEDLSEGIKIYTLLEIIGAYVSMFSITSGNIGDSSAIGLAASLIPFSSPFMTPGALFTGEISLIYGIISLLIMVVCVWFMIVLVSNIYETMIYYNGEALKLKNIIEIAKENLKKGKVKEAKENE